MNKEVRKKKEGKTTSAILLGTLVCFVLIAVYGIVSQLKVSYAFPTAFDQVSADDIESVKSKTTQINYRPSTSWKNLTYKFTVETTANNPKYQLDMFCLEMFREVPGTDDDGTEFKRQSQNKYIDEGINSIVIAAYDNATVNATGNNVTITLSNENYYNAQMAIWIYQNLDILGIDVQNYEHFSNVPAGDNKTKIQKVIGNEDAEITEANFDDLKELQKMWNAIKTSHTSGAAKTIYDYVTNAVDSKTITTKNTISLDGKVELKLTSDKEYYQTDLLQVEITKAVNTEFNGFTFNIKSDNKNVTVELIDQEGNIITDFNSIGDKKFRIRLKASDLAPNSTTNLTGDISGVFKHIGFKEYKATDEAWQIALLAASTSEDESVPLKLSVSVPDTGAGYTGYIYIIGALVLIVGLTVIYVNTKFQEN